MNFVSLLEKESKKKKKKLFLLPLVMMTVFESKDSLSRVEIINAVYGNHFLFTLGKQRRLFLPSSMLCKFASLIEACGLEIHEIPSLLSKDSA